MGNSDSPTTIPLCFGCPSARRYRAVDQRPHRRRRGLSGSWGTSGRALRSQTPAGPLRLALEDDCRCGELLFPAALATRAGASILTMVAVSPPRGALMLPPRTCTAAAPTNTFFRSSITRLAASLSTLRSFPSRSSRSYGHARLASGWWPTFAGRDLHPQGPMRFQFRLHHILLSQDFPDASKRHAGGRGVTIQSARPGRSDVAL
jgi:hypothetical protein